MTTTPKLSDAMQAELAHAVLTGTARTGARTATLAALIRRGLLTDDRQPTDAGRAAAAIAPTALTASFTATITVLYRWERGTATSEDAATLAAANVNGTWATLEAAGYVHRLNSAQLPLLTTLGVETAKGADALPEVPEVDDAPAAPAVRHELGTGWYIGHNPAQPYLLALETLRDTCGVPHADAVALLDDAQLTAIGRAIDPELMIRADRRYGGFEFLCHHGQCAISGGHDSPGGAYHAAQAHRTLAQCYYNLAAPTPRMQGDSLDVRYVSGVGFYLGDAGQPLHFPDAVEKLCTAYGVHYTLAYETLSDMNATSVERKTRDVVATVALPPVAPTPTDTGWRTVPRLDGAAHTRTERVVDGTRYVLTAGDRWTLTSTQHPTVNLGRDRAAAIARANRIILNHGGARATVALPETIDERLSYGLPVPRAMISATIRANATHRADTTDTHGPTRALADLTATVQTLVRLEGKGRAAEVDDYITAEGRHDPVPVDIDIDRDGQNRFRVAGQPWRYPQAVVVLRLVYGWPASTARMLLDTARALADDHTTLPAATGDQS